MTKYVVDTNVLLNNKEIVESNNIVLLSHVLRELEKHKSSSKPDLAKRARDTVNKIRAYRENVTYDLKDYKFNLNEEFDPSYPDNSLIQACYENGYGIITEDHLLEEKALGYGFDTHYLSDGSSIDVDDYDGYKEVHMSKEELNQVYENLDDNKWDLLLNEYLVVKDSDTDKDIDCFRWDGQYLHRVNPKGFNTNAFGKFKPYDHYQKATVDSILNNDLTQIRGKAGSGKSLIALHTAWHLIERNKFDRLIVFANPTKVKGSQELGFYKGNRTEKLLDAQTGIMLTAKFGDEMAVQMAINSGKLMLLPFSDIRGFDTSSEQKTIVWIQEAQNLNSELMKLGLQRIGDDTKVIIDGDPNTQVDMDIYRTDNGMKRTSQVFKGEEVYGQMELKNIYRSPIADIAERM